MSYEQERPEITEQLCEVMLEVQRKHSYLRSASTEIRLELESYLMPLLEWVLEAYKFMGEHDDVRACRDLAESFTELYGIEIEDDQVTLDYNVESEMDERTSVALEAIKDVIQTAILAAEIDPLVKATENPKTQPVVDALRSLAESFAH